VKEWFFGLPALRRVYIYPDFPFPCRNIYLEASCFDFPLRPNFDFCSPRLCFSFWERLVTMKVCPSPQFTLSLSFFFLAGSVFLCLLVPATNGSSSTGAERFFGVHWYLPCLCARGNGYPPIWPSFHIFQCADRSFCSATVRSASPPLNGGGNCVFFFRGIFFNRRAVPLPRMARF